MKTICTESANSKAINKFRASLKTLSSEVGYMEWGFPNGERDEFLTYTLETTLGSIQVGLPEKWSTRIPHLIRFVKDQGPPSPDVEINIPLALDRKVSGLYVDTGTEVLLCSRGLFTSFRGKIRKELALSHFDKWLQKIEDSGQAATVIPVCSLSSESMAEDIASFAKAVISLKESLKNTNVENVQAQPPKWGLGAEFEGSKSSPGTQGVEYDYKHGPLCNQLMQYLASNSCSHDYLIRKNIHVDVALVDPADDIAKVIFEVKTASLPSNQIYTAIGQLAYYKFKYGDEGTSLYVVLPFCGKSKESEALLSSLGIDVIYKQRDRFIDVHGNDFSVSN
ncbi:hypothetical protein [Vibrio fluvialis]|uniref:hypothetical protein n=1 Tax=Vibrio fluvialis TaxID=676 RepID=UPI001EEBD658|nr:hypothetical protein [Vibrio fluvialis]MCG6400142.1 hypothetical protein [Vibrio fluvialis]